MRYYILFTFIVICYSNQGCKTEYSKVATYQKIQGKTMGTVYNITAHTSTDLNAVKLGLDSLLNDFEDELSTYRPQSTISIFNTSSDGICVDKESYFFKSLSNAKSLFETTKGYFDPTIAPLVNYWGFGYDHQDHKEDIDLEALDSLVRIVGMDMLNYTITADSVCIEKKYPAMQLDLNASAKGMGVDIAADYIEKYASDYLVEIGGEVRAKGVNPKGNTWTLGINRPKYGASINDILLPVNVINEGMATSGNYRNYYREGQLTFAHIINPFTGRSQPTDLLSVSIKAATCEEADAYATALMAIGKQKSLDLLREKKNIKACLIFQDIEADTIAWSFHNNYLNANNK